MQPLAGLVEVEPGERAKTLPEAERVLRELARLGMSRADHLVALGGGVVGDLAGFCAATYQRGVEVVQVPTTLVAQVDSAYGGKTGVDLPEAKNYVGAYHLPSAVIADTGTLATLPAQELAAGFVEVVKTALIAGGELWERVRALEELDPAKLGERDLRLRAHQARDRRRRRARQRPPGGAEPGPHGRPRDRGGERVSSATATVRRWGSACWPRCASRARPSFATRCATCSSAMACRPGSTPRSTSTSVLAAVELDKKRTADGVGFVLLERAGEPAIGQRVDPDSVRAAVEELR